MWGGCLEGLGGYLGDVRRLSGECGEAICKMCGGCLEDVGRLSGWCGEAVWGMWEGCRV